MEPNPPESGEKAGRDSKGRFTKGNVPKVTPGRPLGSVSIMTHVKRLLADGDQKQAAQLAQALILQFAKGNGTAIKEIMARVDGPLTEKQEHSGGVTIRVVYEDGDASPAASGATWDRPADEAV